jgi:hypothetical protein
MRSQHLVPSLDGGDDFVRILGPPSRTRCWPLPTIGGRQVLLDMFGVFVEFETNGAGLFDRL